MPLFFYSIIKTSTQPKLYYWPRTSFIIK